MSQGKRLRNRFSTIATEYAVRTHTAAEDAELRLGQLEDRDARRQQRSAERQTAAKAKYPALREEGGSDA